MTSSGGGGSHRLVSAAPVISRHHYVGNGPNVTTVHKPQASSQNGVKSQPVVPMSTSGYKPFIPKSSYHVTLSHSFESVQCKGCGKSFKRASTHHEPEYYIHCIMECGQYRNLGLIKDCHSCKLSFINTNSGRYHSCFNQDYKNLTKPDWMTKSTYLTALMSTNACNKIDTKCPGCNRVFQVATYGKHGGIRHSYEYIVHVVSQCEEYRKLGHIKQCEKCSCLFMNHKALKGHWHKCKG